MTSSAIESNKSRSNVQAELRGFTVSRRAAVSSSLLLGGSYFQLITLKYGLCLDKTLSSHGAGLK